MNKLKYAFPIFLVIFGLVVWFSVSAQAQGIPIPENPGLPDGTISSVLDRTMNWLLKIFVIIAVISFTVTGLQFLFSFGGASGTQEQAKKNLVYTIIAIFIVGGALIILKAILGLLGPSTGGNGAVTNYNYETPTNTQGEPISTGGVNNSGLSSPITNNPSATAGDNGGIYVPDGVYNPSPSDSGVTSNPSATGGGIYVPEGVYNRQ